MYYDSNFIFNHTENHSLKRLFNKFKNFKLKVALIRLLLLIGMILLAFIPIYVIMANTDFNLWNALVSGNQALIVDAVSNYDNFYGAIIAWSKISILFIAAPSLNALTPGDFLFESLQNHCVAKFVELCVGKFVCAVSKEKPNRLKSSQKYGIMI